ncbi:hypothetical protein KUTeg_005759 [Tegillarca granosa]|uniref:TIR domain-containing protein n=1 Tax=Tegillarca granosa TaxID=220873 RepID=A0ABQ9FH97_TEGGR|nr:hypothetical protein KUTeg_005759 [Tegillarca granosa]
MPNFEFYIGMGEGLDLTEDLKNTPIRALGPASRRLLSWYLDPPVDVLTSDGLSRDVTGLADLAGFDSVFIRYLETKQNKTGTFLEAWGTRNNATLVNDVEKWTSKQNVTSQDFTAYKKKTSPLPQDNVHSEVLQKYSACICCADDDLDLANLIVDRYADDGSNFRFFIPQDDLTGGQYEFEATADVIENRCDGRIIVILSENAKGRKIIPIVKDEKVVYPRVLRGITTIKTSRLKHGDSFWKRLTSSLSVFPHHYICNDYESTQNEPGHQRENTSFIDKNIIDYGDTSNLSRDSLSLRSGSFDSSCEFGESDSVGSEKYQSSSRTLKSGLLQSKSQSGIKPFRMYKTVSVPDILEAGNMETRTSVCSSDDNVMVKSSSSCCSLVQAEEKRGSKKKNFNSPKDWLLKKFLHTFQISSKAKSNRMTCSSIVCRKDEGCCRVKHEGKHPTSCTEPCKTIGDEQSSISEKSGQDIGSSFSPSPFSHYLNEFKERPDTFSLGSQSSVDETSRSPESRLEKSAQEDNYSVINESESATTSVSQRTVFTLDI